ncbi:hypothetical protein ACHAWF_017814 [Thalassiosira exigua]
MTMAKPSPPSLLLLLSLLLLGSGSSALRADEVGTYDFLLRTAGHGDAGVRYARSVPLLLPVDAAGGGGGGDGDGDGIGAGKGDGGGGKKGRGAEAGAVWVTSQSDEHPPATIDGGRKASAAGGGGGGGGDRCSVSGRDPRTGAVLWRVDACGGAGVGTGGGGGGGARDDEDGGARVPRHAVLASPSRGDVVTLDADGALRGWDAIDGSLRWDADVFEGAEGGNDGGGGGDDDGGARAGWIFPGGVPRLMDAGPSAVGTVVARGSDEHPDDDESLLLLDVATGAPVKEEGYHHKASSAKASLLSAKALLKKAGASPSKRHHKRARVIDVHPSPSGDGGRIVVWVGWSADERDGDHRAGRAVGTFGSTALAELAVASVPASEGREVSVYQVVRVAPLVLAEGAAALAGEALRLSSWRVARHREGGKATLLAVSADASRLLAATVDVGAGKAKAGRVVEIDALHPYWRAVASVRVDGPARGDGSRQVRQTCFPAGGSSSDLQGHNDGDGTRMKEDGADVASIPRERPPGDLCSCMTIDLMRLKGAAMPVGQSQQAMHRSLATISPQRLIRDTHLPLLCTCLTQVIRVAGTDDRYPIFPRRTESLLLLDSDGGLQRVHGPGKSDEEIHQDALAYCPEMGIAVAAERDDDGGAFAAAYRIPASEGGRRVAWSPLAPVGGAAIRPDGSVAGSAGLVVKRAHVMECTSAGTTVAFTTRGGTTIALRLTEKDSGAGTLGMERLWSAEEALGSAISAVFLDEAHATTTMEGVDEDEEEAALREMQFLNRIRSQWSSFRAFAFEGGALKSLASLALLSDETKAERDAAFGFAKVAVLLSEGLHKIVAVDTARSGRVIWTMDLHPKASWHRLVHGGQFAALNDPHGNGGVHDHETLALSFVEAVDSAGGVMDWKCLDGAAGRVHSSGSSPAPAPVAQVVPLRAPAHRHAHPQEGKGGCRQVALLIHSDRTVSVVPDVDRSHVIVDEVLANAGPNGLFVHTVDKNTGEFDAFRLTKKSESTGEYGLVQVGSTTFDPSLERIVTVAYPRRGEAMQSPSSVVGDDALLLKYLNPHLVVVVTEATPEFLNGLESKTGGGDAFYDALAMGGGSGESSSLGQKRKPLGATRPGVAEDHPLSASTSGGAAPSLFVSLVDSVSGRILHRASHSHAASSDLLEEPTLDVPVVVSENMVVYAFANRRTRRTDVGVLSFHEGMIDKNGITAFHSPEQEETFSSLEAAPPIVLSKTYGLARAVTAVGVTTTRAGISPKQFLFATGNGQVVSIDRRMLDPRRPSGELRESEKMEGLMRYAPLLPIVPLRTPSHLHEVSSVRSVSSAPANVESQSLVLAHGGPDVFFVRMAPAKGFDLLPDDFNRGLLTVVLVGLIALLIVIQRMNGKKMVTTVWM